MQDFSMIRLATRPTPTQRQWLKLKRKRKRRVPVATIGLILTSVAFVLVIAFQVVPHDVGRTVPAKTTASPTAVRSGIAWNGATFESMTASRTVVGRVTHVRDGDTIEVSGRPIRIDKLDCAEMRTADGRLASSRMRALVSGQMLSCTLSGRKSYDRWIGSCRFPDGRDLASVIKEDGYCTRWRG